MKPLAERLSAYLDDELQPAERAALERQIAASPELEQQLAELRAVVDRLRALDRTDPPAELVHQVKRQLHLEPELRGLRARLAERRGRYTTLDWRMLLALLATVLALAVAGIFVSSKQVGPTVIYVPADDGVLRPEQLEQHGGWLVAPGLLARRGRRVALDSAQGRAITAAFDWLPARLAALPPGGGIRLSFRGEVVELVAGENEEPPPP